MKRPMFPWTLIRQCILSILLILCAVLIVACGPYNNQPPDVRTGNEGLVFSVLDGYSKTVQEEETFEIPLMFENKGITDLTGNVYALFSYTYDTYFLEMDTSYSGEFVDNDPYDMDMFTRGGGAPIVMPGGVPYVSSSALAGDLRKYFSGGKSSGPSGTIALAVLANGKSMYLPKGDRVSARLPFVARKLNEGKQFHKTKILTQLCYPYVGIFDADICIDQDKYGLDARDKVCHEESVSIPSSQGSPIAVEDIEVTFVNIKNSVAPRFVITFRNVGDGSPFIYKHENVNYFWGKSSYADDIYEACAVKAQDRKNWNKAMVVPIFLDEVLECTNNNILTFNEYGEAKTYCSFPGVIHDVYDDEYGNYGSMWNLLGDVNPNDIVGRAQRDWGMFSSANSGIGSLFAGSLPQEATLPVDKLQPNFRSKLLVKTAYFYVQHDSVDVIIERCTFCE